MGETGVGTAPVFGSFYYDYLDSSVPVVACD